MVVVNKTLTHKIIKGASLMSKQPLSGKGSSVFCALSCSYERQAKELFSQRGFFFLLAFSSLSFCGFLSF